MGGAGVHLMASGTDLVRPWVVGTVSWPVLMTAAALIYVLAVPARYVGIYHWDLLWWGGPAFVAGAGCAALATWAHRAPHREELRRNTAAALAAPLGWGLVCAVALAMRGGADWLGFATWVLLSWGGAACGLMLIRRLRHRRLRVRSTPSTT
jgi:hypothetical protein